MASFHTVRLACYEGNTTQFNKYNIGSGYKGQGSRPDKVTLHFCFFFINLYIFHSFCFKVAFLCPFFLMLVSQHHDHAKTFWLNQLDTIYSYYKLDLLDYFRQFLGVCDFFLCSLLK